MFQFSAKKFTTLLVSVSMVFCVLFLAGCGKDEEENKGLKLPELPSVNPETDGALNEDAYSQFANAAVTENNLEAFLEMLDYCETCELQGQHNWENKIIKGEKKGEKKVEATENKVETKTELTLKVQYSDFSNSGNLFLGGVIAKTKYKEKSVVEETKVNGEIKFRGAFGGIIKYDNAYAKWTKENDDWEMTSKSGKIVIKSIDGNVEIILNDEDFEKALEFDF